MQEEHLRGSARSTGWGLVRAARTSVGGESSPPTLIDYAGVFSGFAVPTHILTHEFEHGAASCLHDRRQLIVRHVDGLAELLRLASAELCRLPIGSVEDALGSRHSAHRGARLRVVHQLGEHLDRPRTMGAREFGDGLIRLRPAAPVAALALLIWQESRFDPTAVSRAGAQGVAQFMPATANSRGLADPFDPIESIAHSAKLLRDLRRELGNLGLAAAAYNAGPGRVRDWLAGRRGLPRETDAYVRLVTGQSPEQWARGQSEPC